MRATLTIALLIVFATTAPLAGCDTDDESAPISGDTTGGDDDERADGVVVSGSDFQLTIDEIEESVERLRLLAPGVEDGDIPTDPPRWVHNPQAQANLVRDLTRYRLIRRAAAERDIDVDTSDKIRVVTDHDQLGRYQPLVEGTDAPDLHDELRQAGLDIEDVRHLARDIAYERKLTAHLAEQFPDDELWELYQVAEDTADVVIAAIRNTPTSAEIDRADAQYDTEIREHFRENRDRYMTASQATITRLLSDNDVDLERLQQAAERMEEGEPADEIAEDLGLVVDRNVDVSRPRNPQAHRSEVGDAGVLTDPRQQPYAWRVDDRIPPEHRSLDRPLRREIASKVLREQEGITPANNQRAERARQLLVDAGDGNSVDGAAVAELVDELEALDVDDVVHTGEFSIQLHDRIPEIGLAENLAEAIRKLDFEDPVTEPVLDRNVVYVARLIDRSHPDRDTYEEQREDYRAEFLEQNEERLIPDLIATMHDELDIEVHTGVVAEHYGSAEEEKKTGTAEN